MRTNQKILKDLKIDTKLKLAALWIVYMFLLYTQTIINYLCLELSMI